MALGQGLFIQKVKNHLIDDFLYKTIHLNDINYGIRLYLIMVIWLGHSYR